MLPSGFRDKKSAFQIMLYTGFLIPVSMLPWVVNMSGIVSMILAASFGILILIPSIRLHQSLEMKYAKQVMFYSFAYLPLLLLIYFIDKV
jgi:protoheme IX farnesyltransferase